MTILVVNDLADSDIDQIYEDLRLKAGPGAASDYDRRFHALFDRLIEFPESGSLRPEFGARIRIGVINPYLVIYQYDGTKDQVEVLRILHGRRNVSADDF